jgi:hypothetical protein
MERDEIIRIVEDNMAVMARQTPPEGLGDADANFAAGTRRSAMNRETPYGGGVSVVPAILIFFVGLLVSFAVVGTLACSDGWVSGSIGRAGACSHHGGVNRLPMIFAVLLSVFVAVRFHLFRINRSK